MEDPKAPRIPNILGHWYDCQIDRNAVEIAQFETRPEMIEIGLDGQSSQDSVQFLYETVNLETSGKQDEYTICENA